MKKHSAGIIVFRIKSDQLEVLMAHMGTPWWAKKDIGAWSIPKGEIETGENALETAKREFTEEFGKAVPVGNLIELGEVKQHNNKIVTAWAIEADIDASSVQSNLTEIEWPPKSGKKQEFPEIDRAEWMSLADAAKKCVTGQAELFKRLAEKLGQSFKLPAQEQEPIQKPDISSSNRCE